MALGGLSFFQGTEGMACDGVLNHEVKITESIHEVPYSQIAGGTSKW